MKLTLPQQNTFGAASDCRSYSPDEIAAVEPELLSKGGRREYWSDHKPRPKVLHKGGSVISVQKEAQLQTTDKASKLLALVERYTQEAHAISIPDAPTAALFQHKEKIKQARRALVKNDLNYRALSSLLTTILAEIHSRRKLRRAKQEHKRQQRKAERSQRVEQVEQEFDEPMWEARFADMMNLNPDNNNKKEITLSDPTK